MRTYKGIVCEINKNYMIFMTAEGVFLRGTPLVTNAQIGDDVEFQLLTTSLSKKKKSFTIGPALVAAAMIIFFITAMFPTTNSAYAFVQVGNELELGIDEKGTVISVKQINKEQLNIVDLNLEGLPVDVALTKAINQIEKHQPNVPVSTKFNDDHPSKAKEKIINSVNKVHNKHSTDGSTKDNTNIENNKNNNNSNFKTQNSNNEHKQNNSNPSSKKQDDQQKNEEQTKPNKSSNINNGKQSNTKNENNNKKQRLDQNIKGNTNFNENHNQKDRQNNKNSNNQNNGNDNKNNQNKGTSES